MARGKAAAAASEQPKKGKEKAAEEVRERDETEVDEDGEEAVEDDKENERPEKVDDEVEQQLDDEDDEEEKEEAMAGTGKRKKASSDSSSSKRAKASDAHSVVLAYMRRMNRPYSAINVADNLKNALSKTQTSRVLDDLVKDGQVTAKEFGKNKLYFAAQTDEGVSPADVAKVDRQTAEEDQGIETDEAVKVRLEEWQSYVKDVKALPKEVKGKGKKK